MHAIITLILGFVFGLGLIISGMTNPDKVLNFLTFNQQWDGSLIIVMAVAMTIMMGAWFWLTKKGTPVFNDKLSLSDLKKVDTRLITGSILFGLGCGLSAVCPGPGLVQLVSLKTEFWLFFASVLGGMWLTKKI